MRKADAPTRAAAERRKPPSAPVDRCRRWRRPTCRRSSSRSARSIRTSGYRMLVTLTNAGAAVRRAEMSSPRYPRSARLERLPGRAGIEERGRRRARCRSSAPARRPQAGEAIAVGRRDRRRQANPQDRRRSKRSTTSTPRSPSTKPGQEITLQVRRGDGAPQPLTVKLMRRPFAVLRPEIENYRDARRRAAGRFRRSAVVPDDAVDS